MSLGVARSRGSSCTITSYSLLFRVNVLVRVPPSSVWSVAATSPTGTPRSSARSRSKVTVSSGLLTRRSVSTLTRPLICLARATSVSTPFASMAKSGCCTTKLTGLPHPNAGGLLANTKTPGDPEELRLHLADDVLHGARPRGPVVEVDEDDAAAHAVADVDDAEVALDALGAAQYGLGLSLIAVGKGERRSLGRDHEREEPAAIFGRHELAFERSEQQAGADQDTDRSKDDYPAPAQGHHQRAAVPLGHAVEAGLEQLVDPSVTLRAPAGSWRTAWA